MEDYHVDRTDVEAQQCVELTVTNSPFGLTIKFTVATEATIVCLVARQYSRPSEDHTSFG